MIDTPLLVIGRGPAGARRRQGGQRLRAAEPASPATRRSAATSRSLLDAAAVAVLTPHGVFDVLRPYLARSSRRAIAPVVFEEVLKHHCVADMNVTVYDGLELVERATRGTGG